MKLIFVCSFLLLIFGVISGNATTEDECKAKCFVTHQASLKSIKECKKKCEEKKWVCKPNRGRCYSNSCGYHGYSYMWCYCADCVTAETVVAAIFSLGISTDYHWEYCSCSYQ